MGESLMTARKDYVWQSAEVVQRFLEGMRGAIPLAAEQIEVMLRLVQTARPNLTNFLDVGCGDGILGQAIFSRYPDAQGILLDFSQPMIAAARERLKDQPAIYVVEDYGAPAWVRTVASYAPFDAIVSGFSIHHQPDTRKREIYQEIYSLLKPGGIFVNIEHIAPPSEWAESLFDDMHIDLRFARSERQGAAKSREDIAREYHGRLDKEANILTPLDIQLDWMREIGFSQVDCYLKIFELAVFGGIRPNE
jgi:tRNA (cmo5U34)-methyltransferase